jgi:ADP-heptose:LPS heptosyltransferase
MSSITDFQLLHKIITNLSSLRCPASHLFIIFGLGSYGDALQAIPLMTALKDRFPNYHLCLIHPAGVIEKLFYGQNFIDSTIEVPSHLHRSLKSILLEKRACHLIATLKYVTSYTIVPGFDMDDNDKDFFKRAEKQSLIFDQYIHDFPNNNDLLWRKAISLGLNMYRLMALTSGFPDRNFQLKELILQDEHFQIVKRLPSTYVVVSNAAESLTVKRGGWTKTLSRSKFQMIINILKSRNINIVYLGGKDDPPYDNVDYDLRGQTSLLEAGAILKSSKGFIAPEGGIANLANAVGRSGVVFFGSTPPEFFAYEVNRNIIPKSCGGCWWITPSYLYQCPLLMDEPVCTNSIDPHELVFSLDEIMSI